MAIDVNKALEDVQGIANTVKAISDNGTAALTQSTLNVTTDTASSDNSISLGNNVQSISMSDTVKIMETSKKILWTFVIFFVASFLIILAVRVILNIDLFSSLNYQLPITTTTVVGYLTKAGIENYQKNK